MLVQATVIALLAAAQEPTKPTLRWDFAANITTVTSGTSPHPPPATRGQSPLPLGTAAGHSSVVAFKESELASATEQFMAEFDKTQGTVAIPARNETLTVLPFFDEKVCYSAVVPVTDAKAAFQEAVAKALGFKSYAVLAKAWKSAKFVKQVGKADLWEGRTYEHSMTEREITQTTVHHQMHFEGAHLVEVAHITKVNTTTNIGSLAACPFNNTCCHEPGSDQPAKGWGCCPTPGATCCEDKVHCCPSFLPVCDVATKMCKPKPNSFHKALPFDHPLLTQGLNRTRVQPMRVPQATADGGKNMTYARCEGHADTAKCVPCAKGSTHECMPRAECEQQCQVHYECEATKADGGGWNWKCVEQPFVAGRSPGMPKEQCEEQCTPKEQDRYGCEVAGKTVEDARYSCKLLPPIFDPKTGVGHPNPKGSDIGTCNGTDPFAEPSKTCKPTYSCHQEAAAAAAAMDLPENEKAKHFNYTCKPLPPHEGKPNPLGVAESRCQEQCAKRYTCDYADDYTCKECDPCEGQPTGKCNPLDPPEACQQLFAQCHYDPSGTDPFEQGSCQPKYSCEITHDPEATKKVDFNFKCVEQAPGVLEGQFKSQCDEQCTKRFECSFLEDYKCVEVPPEPSAAKAGYPTAGSPFIECSQQCTKPCAFNKHSKFNLTSKITNHSEVVTLHDYVSPAPASNFVAKNPGGASCYVTESKTGPTPPNDDGIVSRDDASLDLPVHIDEEIEAINADPSLPWVAGKYSIWEGKSRRDTLYRYGTKMAAPPHLAKLPVRLDSAAGSDFDAPRSFDARTKWPQCPSIGTIRNQGGCGSCWAFAATESLEDRFCIAGSPVGGAGGCTSLDVLTGAVKKEGCLSPEYIVDCDHHDGGCGGGFLDNAWRFMKEFGVPHESCQPYTKCDYPAFPNCTAPKKTKFACSATKGCVPSSEGHENKTQCEKTCKTKLEPIPKSRCGAPSGGHNDTCLDGSKPTYYKAKSAYAVAEPGDVASMQKEIMEHGPIEVAFYVYGDFQSYKGGIYKRSKKDASPEGGHAVKAMGWGEGPETYADGHPSAGAPIPYWLIANSWSPEWGEKGFFRIERGTNECGIETQPAAGLADTARQ